MSPQQNVEFLYKLRGVTHIQPVLEMDSKLVRAFLTEAIEIFKIITQNSHLVSKYSMVGFTFIGGHGK